METPLGLSSYPPSDTRLFQYLMKTILRLPGSFLPHCASLPPIVSAVDRRLAQESSNDPPLWIIPIKEGKVVNDIVYAMDDHSFWANISSIERRNRLRARLPG